MTTSPLKHIFISHASPDSQTAERLADDLQSLGHHVVIDLDHLRIGDNTIQFMNDAIANAHTIIVIYSDSTDSAVWQRSEIDASTWRSIAHDNATIIVLTLGSPAIPPLLAHRFYARIDTEDTYKAALQRLCTQLSTDESPTSLISKALHDRSSNPFWRVRAEYFDEMPQLLATAFSPPDAARFGALDEMKPCFLEGSRGTGKTMLLLSLRARILSSRPDASKRIEELFGCYLRLDRGAFCNAGFHFPDGDFSESIDHPTRAQLTDIFEQEFFLCLLESVVSEVSFCVRHNALRATAIEERGLTTALLGILPQASETAGVSDLLGLLDHFTDLHSALSDYIRRKFIYRENASVPFTCFDLALFNRAVDLIRLAVPALASSQVTILLDEYENLLPYQKSVVNTLIKIGPPRLSVKIARKTGTDEVSQTTLGQELQETHDYNRLTLIYSVEDDADFALYLRLLDNMVRRIFSSDGQSHVDLPTLLPAAPDPEISDDLLLPEILKLLRVSPADYNSWDAPKRSARFNYYREAAVYRKLYGGRGRHARKRFSGHRELAFISSGVVRFFQEILGMAYYLQTSAGGNFSSVIEPEHQSTAVHTVSAHNLSTLSSNVELHGERLKYFLIDLGDCVRQKLLRHSSEPEAARIAVSDPEMLTSSACRPLRQLFSLGVKEGVFQTASGRPGIRPKHVEDPQPTEINITRMYAPVLEISPRLRWTTRISCIELNALLEGDNRRPAKAKILTRLANKPEDVNLAIGFAGADR